MVGEQIKVNFVECVECCRFHSVFENWSYALHQNKLYLVEAGFVYGIEAKIF